MSPVLGDERPAKRAPAPAAGARSRRSLALLALLALAAALVSLGWGAVSVRPDQVLGVLLDKAGVHTGIAFTRQQSTVLWSIRLPRVLMGLAVGGGLALAGVALQSAFRSRLADPTLLGLSGAGTLGVALAYATGLVAALGRWAFPVAATAAAALAALWLLAFDRRLARTDRQTLVLAGVALQLFLGGVTVLMASAARRPGMPDASTLTLGGLTAVFWTDLALAAPVLAVVYLALRRRAAELNMLLLPEGTAAALGVDVPRVRLVAVLAAAVVSGVAAAHAGAVAFVGLLVPYTLRPLCGDDHRALLPASLLGGAALVCAADALARNLVSPAELPLGTLMTVIGGPLFFWLVGRARRSGSW